ncbi:MAG: leucine--tRNA ligase [Candidatus Micrarchaeota archaeon]|nr:leucine--tRNA ligase [Candidatus Micrarchaeota archaeon]
MSEIVNFRKIEAKWQKKWKENKVFEVEADLGKKKYYLTTPYPYMSGLLHLGHLFTYIAPEVISRFKRMQGFDVLFKFGFHCTGSPIVTAAKKVEEGDEKQINALKKMGISDEEIPKFSNPEYWIEYFPKETLKDLLAVGFSIDPRYTFITTSLNPPYNKMIEWQFRKLREKGYVKKGKHPVVWCPKCNSPVGDHARAEGEGETPQEYLLVKHRLDDGSFIVSATLRPDTILGITNLYVNPDVEYVEIEIETPKGEEKWILGENGVQRLVEQGWKLERIGKMKGSELMGKEVTEFGDYKSIILPATFLDPNVGTGLVHSVPSDSADDLIALWNLQKDEETCKKYGLDIERIRKIKPIEVLITGDLGGNPAEYFLKKYNVKNQNEREKLDKIRAELYKLGFYSSKFGKIYEGFFDEDIVGKPVQEKMNYVKEQIIKAGWGAKFYGLTGKVVCRCGTEAIVKIVSDQWFIEYNDPEWKKKAHECLDKMTLYPEKIRQQFEYVIDWLDHWACTREFGLGTSLPWDKKWKIESLSDSTIQMAYATISKYLQHPEKYGFSVDKIGDSFFDYVFLGKGDVKEVSKETEIPEEMIERMRADFEHWCPFDFRNSAKDLIQNHLTFSIFNHVAIFPEKHWPRAYVINGRVMVNNEKMSKSKGNFFTMRELYEKHGADLIRLAAANAGEGIDDANFDMTFIETGSRRLSEFFFFAKEHYGKGRSEREPIDDWFESKINELIKQITENLENMSFKSAVKNGFVDMNRVLKWYRRRTGGRMNKELVNKFIEVQTKMLAPMTPHIAEEIWSMIGMEGFVSNVEWPEYDEEKIDPLADVAERLIENVMSDIQTVLRLAKVDKPKKLTIFISKQWKYGTFAELKKILEETRDFKEVTSRLLKGDLKAHGLEITKMLPKFLKSGVPEFMDMEREFETLKAAEKFLENGYGCNVEVIKAEETDNPRAMKAMPGKPGMVVE